jgi:hypothetical protein
MTHGETWTEKVTLDFRARGVWFECLLGLGRHGPHGAGSGTLHQNRP